jgi:hypothetical protein
MESSVALCVHTKCFCIRENSNDSLAFGSDMLSRLVDAGRKCEKGVSFSRQ